MKFSIFNPSTMPRTSFQFSIFKHSLTAYCLLLIAIIVAAFLTIFSFYQRFFPLHPPTITEGIVGQPRLINPLYADLNFVDKQISSLIFRGLVKFDENNKLTPDLAESWEISEDGKVYTVKLKRGQLWHDKKEISADDVVFTYQLTQSEDYNGPYKDSFKEVEIEKVDDYTVKFTLKEPFAPFLQTLSLGILPKHLLKNIPVSELAKHSFNLKPVGSGIGKFKAIKFGNGKKIRSLTLTLESKQLCFKFYENENDFVTAFKLGEIDSFATINPELIESLSFWPNQKTYKKPLWGNYFALFFNLENLKLKEVDVRKALAYATPKENQLGEPIDGPIPKISWAFFDGFEKYSYEPEKAKELLKTPLTFTLTNSSVCQKAAQIVAESWKEIGIELELRVVSPKELSEVIARRDFEILLMGQEVPRDPDVYTFWHSTQREYPGLNVTGFSNRRVDKALEDGRRKLKPEERKEAYKDFQTYLAQEVPAIFLYRPNLYYVVSTKIKNVTLPKNLWYPSDCFNRVGEWE